MLDTSLRCLKIAAMLELFGHLELQDTFKSGSELWIPSLFPEQSSFLMVKWLWRHLLPRPCVRMLLPSRELCCSKVAEDLVPRAKSQSTCVTYMMGNSNDKKIPNSTK